MAVSPRRKSHFSPLTYFLEKKKVLTYITMLACSIMLDLHREFALPFYFCGHALP